MDKLRNINCDEVIKSQKFNEYENLENKIKDSLKITKNKLLPRLSNDVSRGLVNQGNTC